MPTQPTIPYWLLNLVLFKFSWLALVLGQNSGIPLALILQVASLWLHPNPRQNFQYILSLALFGIVLDYLLGAAHVFDFGGTTFPAWLVLLWLAFAHALSSGFVILHKLGVPLLGFIGAVFGPFSYWLGQHLGAVAFPQAMGVTMLLLALLWSLFLPGAVLALRWPITRLPSILPLLLVTFTLLESFPARADHAQQEDQHEWRQLGSGSLNFLFRPVYEATLHVTNDSFDFPSVAPFRLEIHYRMDIRGAWLLRETLKQWQAQQVQASPTWINQLEAALPDVNKGDRLTLLATEKQAQLMHNDTLLASFHDTALVEAFAGIWLAVNTTQPDLRRQLLGKAR
jgi:hypothetical protein